MRITEKQEKAAMRVLDELSRDNPDMFGTRYFIGLVDEFVFNRRSAAYIWISRAIEARKLPERDAPIWANQRMYSDLTTNRTRAAYALEEAHWCVERYKAGVIARNWLEARAHS